MELDYIEEKIKIINHRTQEIKVHKAKLLDIVYLYQKYNDNNLTNKIKILKNDISEYKIYVNKKIDDDEYNYKQNTHILKILFIITLLFFIITVYEDEVTKHILQTNINIFKFLIIIDILSIISTTILLFICSENHDYNEQRKNIEIQLNYFYHLCDSVIYSIEKEK